MITRYTQLYAYFKMLLPDYRRLKTAQNPHGTKLDFCLMTKQAWNKILRIVPYTDIVNAAGHDL